MTDSKNKTMPAECAGCARRVGNQCIAFKHPAEMWHGSEQCWAHTSDPDSVIEEHQDMIRYSAIYSAQRDVETAIQCMRRYKNALRRGVVGGGDPSCLDKAPAQPVAAAGR